MNKYILVRIWYKNGEYTEKEYNISENDYQITNNEKYGDIETLIIDTY